MLVRLCVQALSCRANELQGDRATGLQDGPLGLAAGASRVEMGWPGRPKVSKAVTPCETLWHLGQTPRGVLVGSHAARGPLVLGAYPWRLPLALALGLRWAYGLPAGLVARRRRPVKFGFAHDSAGGHLYQSVDGVLGEHQPGALRVLPDCCKQPRQGGLNGHERGTGTAGCSPR